MAATILPMNLGDIFDRIFKVVGKTFVRNLIIAVLILAPASLLMAYGFDTFFSSVVDLIRQRQMTGVTESLAWGSFFGSLTLFGVAGVIVFLAMLSATLGVTIVACHEMGEQPIVWQDALGMTFSMRWLRAIGQALIVMVAIGGVIAVPYVLLIGGAAADSSGVTVIGVLLFLVAIPAVIFLFVRWSFALPAIAWEGAGVLDSLRRSWFLVGGLWWRTFGILLLLTIVWQFALSIITTPFSLIFFWDFFGTYFNMLGSMGGGEPDPEVIIRMLNSLGFGLGLFYGLSMIVSVLVTPMINVVMYFDLRARKGEFDQPLDSTQQDGGEARL